jgi:drug/metabolite transporter (DMT)-like permease
MKNQPAMSVQAAYLGVILIWSTTPLAIQWSGREVGFLFGVTARMLIGTAVAVLLLSLLGLRMPWDGRARGTYLASGLGIFGAMLCVYWGAQFIPSGWISVIFGLAPIVTSLMARRYLSEEPLTLMRLAGLVLALSGLCWIFLGGADVAPKAGYGVTAVLVSVVIYSASSVAVKRIGAAVPALAITTGGLLVASTLFTLTFLLSGSAIPEAMSPRTGLAIVYLGLVGSVVGFLMYYYVLGHVEATKVALLTLVTPVLALMLGNALNQEPLSVSVLTGTAAILLGLVLFQFGAYLGGLLRRRVPARPD